MKGLPEPNPYQFTQQLNGKIFELSPQSIGLFPLFIQIFHNNMTEGVQKISFACEKGNFSVNFWNPANGTASRPDLENSKNPGLPSTRKAI